MKGNYNVLDLKKELSQSKIIIDLNDINNENKFLEAKTWDCLNGDKILELDKKVEDIYKELDNEHLKNLEKKINDYDFNEFYEFYRPKLNNSKIGALCDLDCLVDSTYIFEINKKDKLYDLAEMGLFIFNYRSIEGDGDCFYRSLIFSILENIILMNNIMQMKELLILFHEKINLNNRLINEKEYLKVISYVNINEILEILYLLITKIEKNDLQTAYTMLLKVFIFNQDFDFAIIIFTRYLLYEYISANEDKIYSKEFLLEVGCLLPDNYIIDKGNKNEYYFENYFSEELMNPKTFAEKIIVYIAPYVFNINMNILDYCFGENGAKSVITEKKFNNEKKDNFQCQINLLYRKNHYDVYYKYDFWDKYKEYLNILKNKSENIKNLEENESPKPIHENSNLNNKNNSEENNNINNNFELFDNNNIKENKIDENIKEDKNINKNNINNNSEFSIFNNKNDNEITKSKIFIRDMVKINNIPENNSNNNNNNNNINNNNDNNNQINKNININNNLPTCLECHNNYEKEDYFFGLCDACLLSNLKTLLLAAFMEFLKNPENLINSREKFRQFLTEKICKISFQEDINLYAAIYNSKFNFNDLLLNVRNSICLFCGKQLNNPGKYFLELPCKCGLCCERCFIRYCQFIILHIALKEQKYTSNYKYLNLLSCFCGFTYNTQNVLYMIKETAKRNLTSEKTMYMDYIDNFWNWRCCMCKNNFTSTKTFYKFTFLCEKIDINLLNQNTKLKHLICNDCYLDYNINQIKIIDCNICELEHSIIELNKVNGYNEESDMII